jgi:hypothetical protein
MMTDQVALPRDIVAHVFLLLPLEDLARTPGIFNVCKLWRNALIQRFLVPLGLHHLLQAENYETKIFNLLSPLGTWNSELLFVFLKWPCFFYRGKFVSSMIHGVRAASAAEILSRFDRFQIIFRVVFLCELTSFEQFCCLLCSWSIAEREWSTLFDEALSREGKDDASILEVLNRYISSFDAIQSHKDPRNEEHIIDDNLRNLLRWQFAYNAEETRFPLSDAVRLVKIWTNYFPGLPRMFWVSMDPFGRPMFRWSAWAPEFWQKKHVPHPYELRISFKSIDFIRITIEGLAACTTEPRWEDSELFTGAFIDFISMMT